MIKEAIKQIQEMSLSAAGKPCELFGLPAFMDSNGIGLIKPPQVESIRQSTLESIDRYLEAEEFGDKPIIIIESNDSVSIYKMLNEYNYRERMLNTTFTTVPFKCGQYMDVEDFIINVQTKFDDSPDKKRLIDFVSKVREEDVSISEDDGISQSVTVTNRMGRLEKTDTNPIHKLRPYRTFSEVEQPMSSFLLRIRSSKEGGGIALFDADNGGWRVEAINNIREYLLELPQIKEKDIKVIG